MRAIRVLSVLGLVIALAVAAYSASAVASPSTSAIRTAAASEGPYITAVGTGVSTPNASQDLDLYPQTLFVGAQLGVSAAEVEQGLRDLTARISAIRVALSRAGAAESAIRMQNLAVYPLLAQKRGDTLQPITSYSLNANMQVDLPSVRLLVSAMEAAVAAGATEVSSVGKGVVGGAQNVQPPTADLDRATSTAIANARFNAEAIARATGKRLGAIHSVSAIQPQPDCCPPGAGWRVQVTVTFEYD